LPNTGNTPLLPIAGLVLLSVAGALAMWRRRA
jgi:LPXTG-motif cell wall-anchored protein